MNVVVVQGVLAREPQERTLPDGSIVVDWQVTTGEVGAKRTVPVQWVEPSASVRSCAEGADVMVLGAVRTRWFKAGGANISKVEVIASAFANPKRAAAVARLRAKAEAMLPG